MKLNPMAFVFWGICACTGYLLDGARGAVAGLLFGMVLSVAVHVIGEAK